MTVTRLERKARRNKTRAKERVKEIKRNVSRIFIKSPYKDESGVILEEDVMTIAKSLKSAPATAAKESKKVEEVASEVAAPAVDKLNEVEGIGPKIATVLNEAGILTFADLAASTPEKIREILDNAEGNFAAHDPATWPKQAEMAAEGKWDELKTWQDELKGGKEA
ncbi:MAG: hypothetical protein GC181_03000 [Bacteroidetes bacterium]|nr:hypothetical protein [Bacteroidota bacterium]